MWLFKFPLSIFFQKELEWLFRLTSSFLYAGSQPAWLKQESVALLATGKEILILTLLSLGQYGSVL